MKIRSIEAATVAVVAVVGVCVIAFGASRSTARAAIGQIVLSHWLAPEYLGDGKPAEYLLLCNPMGIELTRDGELLISDRGRERRGRVVWRIDREGVAHVVAGTGRRGHGAGDHALDVSFDRPEGMAVAPDGSLYLSDGFVHVVFKIDPDGRVTRVAGTGIKGYAGDGGSATSAQLHRPADVKLDSKGNLYIADVQNHAVRRLGVDGIITTVAGIGSRGFSPDGTPAASARLDRPWGILVDRHDRLIIADSLNHRLRRVTDDGRLVTIAGTGTCGYSGDGGPATEAELNSPEGMFEDEHGRLYFGDELNHAIRVIDLDGTVRTVMGTGAPGRAAIGRPARGAPLDDPENVRVLDGGDVIVTDGNNGRVLRLDAAGTVRLLAGRGSPDLCANRF